MTNINLKTHKLNLKNSFVLKKGEGDLIYSRLLNQQIDSDKVKKFNLYTQIVQEKSLKSKVADITKLNANLNFLSSQNRFNVKDNKSIVANGEVRVLNKSTHAHPANPSLIIPFGVSVKGIGTKGYNMLADYISYKQSQKQILQAPSNSPILSGNPKGSGLPCGSGLSGYSATTSINFDPQGKGMINNKFKIKKYLQTIYGAALVLSGGGVRKLALSQDLVYNFNNSFKKFKLDSILENSFYSMNSLIGTKVYEMTPNNISLQLFFYAPQKGYKSEIRYDYLQYLCAYISKKIKKPFKLNLIKLRNVKSDTVLSAKAIGILANKLTIRFKTLAHRFFKTSRVINPKMFKNVFYTNSLSHLNLQGTKEMGGRSLIKLSFCTGIHIKLGGRLKGQSLESRLTTMTIQNGNLNRGSSDILTTSRFTSKSIRGAFSITVTMGHKFF